MRYRICLALVTSFFVVMNVLLWRSEFGARGHLGTPVPTQLVWEKILTAPDNSYLEIRHHGIKVGRAHWAPAVGEELLTGKVISDEPLPEGMVKQPTGYTLDFDGTISLDEFSRVSFDFNVKLDTNRNWRDLSIKLRLKPVFSWQLQASAEKETVSFSYEEDGETTVRIYTFAELQHPERLVRDLGGPTLSGVLGAFGMSLPQFNPASVTSGMAWEAENDRIKVGSTLIRVYRIEARLFDRYKAVLFVSPVGELLRMELPDEILLINDALISI